MEVEENYGILRITEELLASLSITSRYHGYFYTVYAVTLAAQDHGKLLAVTKQLYPETAQRFDTTWQCVEHSIRTVLEIAWKKHRDQLDLLAGYPLEKRPSVGQFLAILTQRSMQQLVEEQTQQHRPIPSWAAWNRKQDV